MAACFESDAVHSRIDFRHAEDLFNLFRQRGALLEIDDCAPKALGLGQPFVDHIADDDDRCSEQMAGSRASQTDRAGAGHIDG